MVGWALYRLASVCLFSLIRVTFLLGITFHQSDYLPSPALTLSPSAFGPGPFPWVYQECPFPWCLLWLVLSSLSGVILSSPPGSSCLKGLSPCYVSFLPSYFLQSTSITACKYFVDSWIDSLSPPLKSQLWEGKGLACLILTVSQPLTQF